MKQVKVFLNEDDMNFVKEDRSLASKYKYFKITK